MKKERLKFSKFIISVFLVFTLVFSSCTNVKVAVNNGKEDSFLESGDGLKKFSSSAELTEFLKNNQDAYSNYNYFRGGIGVQNLGLEVASVTDFAGGTGDVVVESNSKQVASDYSKTNVQVEGVDEPDFVKNDDKYIYLINSNKLKIVNAFPGNKAEILSEVKLEGNPMDMFVNGNRIVIFSNNYDDVYKINEYDYKPTRRSETKTYAYVYDVTDKSEPKLVKEYAVTGGYYEARMIENYIYFISKESIYYSGGTVPIPGIRQNGVLLYRPEVYYFDNPESSYVLHTVAAFNIYEDREKIEAKTFMLGYSNTLYMSENNIYITYQKNYPPTYYEYQKADMFFNVVVPLLPDEDAKKIRKVETDLEYNEGETYTAAWDRIALILENMYNYMDETEKEDLLVQIDDVVAEYEAKIEDERSRTVIHKIGIERDKIDYLGKGEVRGNLLNQFSMDEKDENLRVATTTRVYSKVDGFTMYNNVFVLDKNLETIGSIEKIAPDESIYSTRFMGNKLYMVTFERVDPLFVIDLSDPENPEIKGQLKIPGFSNYLHPYDENHIIGIGKETYETEFGAIRSKGVKVSMFDVSDMKNPKEVDSIVIGDEGSNSQVLYDHKALLFDHDKNLLAFPVTEVEEKYEEDDDGYFRNKVWNGAYVLTVTTNGFDVRGKVTHEQESESNYYYWSYPYNVQRLLYMDDNLYTISERMIKINDLGTVDEIGEVKLSDDIEKDYPVLYENLRDIAVESPGIEIPSTTEIVESNSAAIVETINEASE